MNQVVPCSSCSGRTAMPLTSSGPGRTAMDSSITSRSLGSLAGRRVSHSMASTSGRDGMRRRGRSRILQVDAALFEPPPFQPKKLSVQYLPGAEVCSSSAACIRSNSSSRGVLPHLRRYTLTHNDITGALQLSIGSEYNRQQVQGFYTRILRDEITAEWLFGVDGSAPAELHIYCHVSGEERWLAPPQLRNFIFRREMTLVLDTFLYADRRLLQTCPDLFRAKVYVHFQSDVQDLDLREYWGVLGDRATWRRMPKGVLARLKLLLFGFPALPHSRPRHALTHQQQQQQQLQQQQEGTLVPAAAAAAAAAVGTAAATVAATAVEARPLEAVTAGEEVNGNSSSSSSTSASHQWHPAAELAVEGTRPVALSLQEQRKEHQRQHQQQQHTQHDGQALVSQEQQQQQQQQEQQWQAAPVQAVAMQGRPQQQQQQPLRDLSPCEGGQQEGAGDACTCCNCMGSPEQSSTGDSGNSAAMPHSVQHQFQDASQQQQQVQAEEQQEAQKMQEGPAQVQERQQMQARLQAQEQEEQQVWGQGQEEQQLQWQLPSQARLQQQLEQLEQAATVEAFPEWGRWSATARQPSAATAVAAAAGAAAGAAGAAAAAAAAAASAGGAAAGGGAARELVQVAAVRGSSSSSSSGSTGSNVVPALGMLGGPSALPFALQQQQQQQQQCSQPLLVRTASAGAAAVLAATVVSTPNSSSSSMHL